MFQPRLFADQIALVTGGGSGIGYAIAKQLLSLGATVYIASRKEERLQAAHAELSTIGPCHYAVLDIRQTESIQALSAAIRQGSGRLDILVNNAGGQFPSAALDISTKGWLAVINNNLNGTWFVTQTLAKDFFVPQKHGVIVNIIAMIDRGFPGMAHTGAARAGVDNLTKSLSVEWAPHQIRVNAIAPGYIRSTGLDQYPQEFVDRLSQAVPLKRMGSVEDVAYLSLFLASPMASYITGETVYVDGGARLWGDLWQIE